MMNNVIVDNQAGLSGGAMYLSESKPDLYHTTFARNESGDGTGIYITKQASYPISNVEMFNTIIVSHSIGIYVKTGNVVNLEGTLWGSGIWANGDDWQGGGTIHTGTLNLYGDPDFISPNQGDYHLGPQSLAIDGGIDSGVYTDMDGDTRPTGSGFDMGADEFVSFLFGMVILQGRTDHSGAVVTAWSGETIVATTTTDIAGAYALSIPDGVYKITIEMPQYLDAIKNNVVISNASPTSLAPVALKGGDTNDSDNINILDLSLIGSHYGLTCADPGWDPRADINGDCVVNLLDLTLAAANFGKTSPVMWE